MSSSDNIALAHLEYVNPTVCSPCSDLGNEFSVSNLPDVPPLPAPKLMPTIAPNLTMAEGELPQELLAESEFSVYGMIAVCPFQMIPN